MSNNGLYPNNIYPAVVYVQIIYMSSGCLCLGNICPVVGWAQFVNIFIFIIEILVNPCLLNSKILLE